MMAQIKEEIVEMVTKLETEFTGLLVEICKKFI